MNCRQPVVLCTAQQGATSSPQGKDNHHANSFSSKELFCYLCMHTNKPKNNLRTLLVHAGEKPDPVTGAIAPILVRTKTYKQNTFGVEARWQYSRGTNPTRTILESKLAEIEGSGQATVFSSGVAAEASFFLTLNPGDHILFCQEVYGGTFRLLEKVMSRFGIMYDFVDFTKEKTIVKHITPKTKYLYVETPTNPSLHMIDLDLVGKISKKSKIPYVADMTFSPPCATRAFHYGAETVIHSLSKYYAGHNDVIGGAVITKNEALHKHLLLMQRTLGAILSPDECYRVIQGMKTLQMRWEYVSANALQVAEYLNAHSKIKRALYPGLKNHPGNAIAKKQMSGGYGGVLSFETRDENKTRLKKFVDCIQKRNVIIYGESLASPESILAYPPLMSHGALPRDVRLSLGISDGFFRLSVGFEDYKDIINSMRAGLKELR